jgi:hypothetical protein
MLSARATWISDNAFIDAKEARCVNAPGFFLH